MGRPERPIKDATGGLGEFARALRQLREDAGRPTYQAMARDTEVSRSALAQAATGQRLPRWRTVEQYVQYCGGDLEQWRQRWERLRAEPSETAEEAEADVAGQSESVPPRSAGATRRILIGGAVVLTLFAVGAGIAYGASGGPHRRQPNNPHRRWLMRQASAVTR